MTGRSWCRTPCQTRSLIPILLAALSTACLQQNTGPASALVDRLDFDDYKSAIEALASIGDRSAGSESYDRAALWVEAQLAGAGYTVEHHEYRAGGATRSNIYVTKVGTTVPGEMFIVSAHLDGMGGGGGADDDASGSALVLLAALALAADGVETARSIRFMFWNDEETGRIGSQAYARDRAELQGIEMPVGSGRFPEPRWLGIIQHDMLLFDHGMPPGPGQIAAADIDIEYQQRSRYATAAQALARSWQQASIAFSTDYPAEIGSDMNFTDSVSLMHLTPAISVRENRRSSEIGRGANPHWHAASDVYATYSDADFRLGFNALQMTVGAVATLAGVR